MDLGFPVGGRRKEKGRWGMCSHVGCVGNGR